MNLKDKSFEFACTTKYEFSQLTNARWYVGARMIILEIDSHDFFVDFFSAPWAEILRSIALMLHNLQRISGHGREN